MCFRLVLFFVLGKRRQIIQTLQIKAAQEVLGRAVQKRPSRQLKPALLFDQTLCRQGADNAGAIDAAHLLDKALGDKYTLGVAGNAWNIKFTNAAIEAIDSFELMSYDLIDEHGRHSTYEGTLEQIQQLGIRGMLPEKVNVGIPFYSRPTDMSAYWYGYNSCYDGINEDGWYHCNDIDKDFWFNTPEVVAQKTEYCINNGFGGVMIWHYNCDLPSTHEDSLLRAIGETIDSHY